MFKRLNTIISNHCENSFGKKKGTSELKEMAKKFLESYGEPSRYVDKTMPA